MILAMIENDAAERVIDAVIDVVTGFASPNGFANNASDRGRCGRYQESARLRQNLNVLGEEPLNLGVDLLRQCAERFDVSVVRSGEATPNVEDFDFAAARLGLAQD